MSARSLVAGFVVLVAAGWLASCGLVTPKQAWVKAGAFEGGDPVVFMDQSSLTKDEDELVIDTVSIPPRPQGACLPIRSGLRLTVNCATGAVSAEAVIYDPKGRPLATGVRPAPPFMISDATRAANDPLTAVADLACNPSRPRGAPFATIEAAATSVGGGADAEASPANCTDNGAPRDDRPPVAASPRGPPKAAP